MFDQHPHEYRQHDDGPELPAHLAALEGQLARLSPAAPRIDRDRLMFDAGRASPDRDAGPIDIAEPYRSGRKTHHSNSRFWPITAATMTAATLLLSAMLVWQSQHGRSDEQIAKPIEPANSFTTPQVSIASAEPTNQWPMETWLATPANNYLAMRQIVLARGVSALDWNADFADRGGATGVLTPPGPATARELLEELMPETVSAIQILRS